MPSSLSAAAPAGLPSGTMGWIGYVSFSHSALAVLRIGMPGALSFKRVKNTDTPGSVVAVWTTDNARHRRRIRGCDNRAEACHFTCDNL